MAKQQLHPTQASTGCEYTHSPTHDVGLRLRRDRGAACAWNQVLEHANCWALRVDPGPFWGYDGT